MSDILQPDPPDLWIACAGGKSQAEQQQQQQKAVWYGWSYLTHTWVQGAAVEIIKSDTLILSTLILQMGEQVVGFRVAAVDCSKCLYHPNGSFQEDVIFLKMEFG